ncbi:peptidoglycan-binding protein [Streptomyces lydicus]|uniref:peptidoglycan-binding protein n=1 Tax=Streptomyces lydicus TaxID=47763 RepID=UPI001F50BFF4|nr:peptidoglycan-binding protein [Streptomyces lydicus]
MTAQTCPHCCTPVRGGGRPSCLCAAVGADDFDPLRIRPYVSLPDGDGDGDGEADDDGDDHGGAGGTGTGRGDLLDLPGVDAAVHLADGPSNATGPPLTPGSASTGPAEPLEPRMRRRPGPASRTFRASEEPAEEPAGRSPASLRRQRALAAVLLTAGAAVAATAVLIGTDALSDDTRTRAAAPARGTASPRAALPTGGASAPAPSGPASPTATRSPSPDATTPETTVRPYRTPAPRPPAPTRASGSVSDSPATHGPSAPPTGPLVLREGAGGPEVRELQGRLRQLALYTGPDDGRYDADVRDAVSRYQRAYGVAGDPDGVYGAVTRASLESRTHEP